MSGANYTDLLDRLNTRRRITRKIGERIPLRTSRWHFDSEGPEITGISSATPCGGLLKQEKSQSKSQNEKTVPESV